MDTVGDAYIAATLLPLGPTSADGADADAGGYGARTDTDRRQLLQESCMGALEVARAMIEAVEEHRRSEGSELRCRIGLSVGPVVAGVVGRLQVRSLQPRHAAQWAAPYATGPPKRRMAPSGATAAARRG